MTLFQVFNQTSFLFISGFGLAIAALILLGRKARRGWAVWGALLMAAVIGSSALRTTDDVQLTSAADYEAALRAGRPTLIEFYSNY